MGIAGFTTWMKRRYPRAFSALPEEQEVEHLYLDLASLLHQTVRKARTKAGFHKLLHRRLDEVIAVARPTKRVVLALDGPAPLAKLLEQRRRRRREAFRDVHGGKPRRKTALSSLALTTGTPLMLEIHQSLMLYICRRLADPATRHLHFELSDSTVKGEGELKILSRLLHAGQPGDGADGGPAGGAGGPGTVESHLVVGGDSDLLLMALISGQPNVWVLSDQEGRGAAPELLARSSAFSCNAVAAAWQRAAHLPEAPDQASASLLASSLALDLALLAIMSSGNDYLPGMPGLQLTHKNRPGLWDLYLDMRASVPEWAGAGLVLRSCGAPGGCPGAAAAEAPACPGSPGGGGGGGGVPPGCARLRVSVNAGMLGALLERYHRQRYLSHPERRPPAAADRALGSWCAGPLAPLDPSAEPWSASSWSEPSASSLSSLSSLSSADEAEENALGPALQAGEADPAEYLRGLEWVLHMYATGAVGDYRWAYDRMPPTLPALAAALRDTQAAQAAQAAAALAVAAGDGAAAARLAAAAAAAAAREPLLPAACAMALLPKRGRGLAATALRHLMDDGSPVAGLYYVCPDCMDMARRISSAARELDAARAELVRLQLRLAEQQAARPEAAHRELEGAVLRCEAACEVLRGRQAELSRAQAEHTAAAHPRRPFPAAELEAAVAAVPLDQYPRRERRLTRFGREFLFRFDPTESAAAAAEPVLAEPAAAEGQPVLQGGPRRREPRQPAWVEEAFYLTNMYPGLLGAAAQGGQGGQGSARPPGRLLRRMLPARPYMLSPPPRGTGAPPASCSALQLRRSLHTPAGGLGGGAPSRQQALRSLACRCASMARCLQPRLFRMLL